MIANLEVGIHDLSADVYHADPCPSPSLSSGIAKILLKQSPQHAWLAHPRLNPEYQREIDHDFNFGVAAHAMLLENDASKIVIVSADNWRTKAAREAREEAAAQGKVALLERHFASVEAARIAARAYIERTELAGIFDTGDAEQSIVWQEDEIWCRARPDLISADRRVILDYKSTESAAPEDCARVLGSLWYDLQDRFYTRGLKKITGHESVQFAFLFQETHAPFACSLIGLSNSYQELGDLRIDRAIRRWGQCINSGEWYGYSNRILYCEPKPWQVTEYADE